MINWKIFGLVAAFLIASAELTYKYKLTLKKGQSIAFTCIILLCMGICGLLYLICVKGLDIVGEITNRNLMIAPIIGALISMGFILFYEGTLVVNNPTLLAALFAGSKIMVVFLGSYLIFGASLTTSQLLSIGLITSGILLLCK
tara:strand:+ start:47 stop:478 length:432 start_codon:yes stop_codon:yes gene_type:complete